MSDWKPVTEYADGERYPLLDGDPLDAYAQNGPDDQVIVVLTGDVGDPQWFCYLKLPRLDSDEAVAAASSLEEVSQPVDIRGFVKHVLELMKDADVDGTDVDGAELEEAALKHGLLEERPATVEERETDWGQDHDVEVGDPVTAMSAALKEYLFGEHK